MNPTAYNQLSTEIADTLENNLGEFTHKPTMTPMPQTNFAKPEYFLNRELSLIEFNQRVLANATDESVPLLERLRFLCISSSNLDEFFEIRVAGIKQMVELGSVQAGPDNLQPAELLRQICGKARALVEQQYSIFNNYLVGRLAEQNIRFLPRNEWSERQVEWLQNYFFENLMPVMSPLGLDPAHPFPRILNKSLNFIVSLEGKDAFGRSSNMAIVQAPRSLPRLINIEGDSAKGPNDYVFLSSIIHEFANHLFLGMKINGCYQFRVTRNGDLLVEDEEVDDLKRALEGELLSRRFSDAVRLEVADTCPEDISAFLLHQFELEPDDLYQVNGPVNLNRLANVIDIVDRPDLKFPAFTPSMPQNMVGSKSLFHLIREKDILLHHPFQSFAPVVDFVRQAASDPNVLAIKQTLYRTGSDSAIVEALVEAAKAGKEVTVIIELRARFDEEDNIRLATKLQSAGAHVVYGVVGYKTHAKMIYVVRREKKILRRYVHLGTGNYHSRTARLYTDFGLFTSQKIITNDVHKLFHQLTGLGKAYKLKKLLQAPFNLHESILKLIEQETEFAAQGKEGRIIAKMNALVDTMVIQKLYEASCQGVQIDLIIRGICCLRPGIPGISENIRVRSVIGRFLEHTRIYYFHNDGDSKVYLSSADWMQRNFFQRVEASFPIDNEELKTQAIKQGLHFYLEDNTQAWLLQSDGTYLLKKAGKGEEAFSAQTKLLQSLAESAQ